MWILRSTGRSLFLESFDHSGVTLRTTVPQQVYQTLFSINSLHLVFVIVLKTEITFTDICHMSLFKLLILVSGQDRIRTHMITSVFLTFLGDVVRYLTFSVYQFRHLTKSKGFLMRTHGKLTVLIFNH